MVPPGLAWLSSFCASTGTALDQGMVSEAKVGVNALTYRVSVSWGESISFKNFLLVWNLFQKWAARNDCVPSGRVDVKRVRSPLSSDERMVGFETEVNLKRRLGLPQDHHPMT